MAHTPKADALAAPVQHDRARKREEEPAAALPPDPGEGAAAEASPAADGPPPAQEDGDALIAEMAFPVGAGPDRATEPDHQGRNGGAPPAAADGDVADPRGRR